MNTFFGFNGKALYTKKENQKFVYTKIDINSPISKKEFLDNMNLALSDINLEQNEELFSFEKTDENLCSSRFTKDNQLVLKVKYNPEPFSRISTFQL